jgi:hypothetical protein
MSNPNTSLRAVTSLCMIIYMKHTAPMLKELDFFWDETMGA